MSDKVFLMFDQKWIEPDQKGKKWNGAYRFRVGNLRKDPMPFLKADKPYESFSTGYASILYDQGLYRLWYEAWDNTYVHDYDGRLCYAESTDSINWRKPVLGLVEYNGSKDNNIVFDPEMAGKMGFHGSNVFVDPSSPPESRYRMIFGGTLMKYTNRNEFALMSMSFAYSADGLHWKWGIPEKRNWLQPPLTAFGSDTQSVSFWDDSRQRYVGYFRGLHGERSVRSIARSETSEFDRWPHPVTVLVPDDNDEPDTDFYNNAASRYESGGDSGVFLFISMYNHHTDTLDVQLATSRDGICFERQDRTPLLRNDTETDKGGIYLCPGIITIGKNSMMAYSAREYCHEDGIPGRTRYGGSYNMLRFVKDRLMGLYSDQENEFTLKGFDYAGGALTVTINAAVNAGGVIKAGILAGYSMNEYIEGFTMDDCAPVTGDSAALHINWKGGKLSDMEGSQLRIRFYMKNSVIYSIRVQNQ